MRNHKIFHPPPLFFPPSPTFTVVRVGDGGAWRKNSKKNLPYRFSVGCFLSCRHNRLDASLSNIWETHGFPSRIFFLVVTIGWNVSTPIGCYTTSTHDWIFFVLSSQVTKYNSSQSSNSTKYSRPHLAVAKQHRCDWDKLKK